MVSKTDTFGNVTQLKKTGKTFELKTITARAHWFTLVCFSIT